MLPFKKKILCKTCNEKISDNDEKYKVVLETLEGDHIIYPVCSGCGILLGRIHEGVKLLTEGEEDV